MITVIILTRNSADSLVKTLESVSWCDEIIIIDDESTDETVNIAKKYQAHIYERALNNDFAGQRNFGLTKTKGPARNASSIANAGGEWVVFVDSDEVVSEELKKEILEKIPNSKSQIPNKFQNTNIQGFFVKRRDVFLGKELKHGETAGVKLLRLAKKNSGTWISPIHEIWDIKGKTELLSAPLLHFPHKNVAQFLEKINKYSTINAQYLYEQGVRPSIIQIFGYPLAKFFVNYLLKFGFLDGTPGFAMAMMMSFHSFLTRAKLWQLWQKS